MRRNGLISLIFIVVLAVAGLSATFVADNEPLLGLDLQGGVSVVLQPTEDTTDESLGQAIEIIRQRVDSLGVAEPDIARQGDAIVVQLPGIDDRDRALELVGQTAELRFRPVLENIPQQLWGIDEEGLEELQETTTTTAPGGEGSTTTTTAPAEENGAQENGSGVPLGESAAPAQTDDTSGETTTTTAPPPISTPSNEELLERVEPTPPEDAVADEEVTLSQYDGDTEIARFRLGPTEATGEILTTASAELQGVGTWQVAVEIDGDSLDQFNEIASRCFNQDPTCPTGQLAIVLDTRVQSAPAIQEPTFGASGISITGDFTEGEAKDLALVLRYGALPVELEPQQTQSVSATIGQDALDAGVSAGVIGLALVALYMLVYYRMLGLVAILSLALSGALLWTVVAYLGDSQGLALTLAGVTGLIVSIGVAVDSNVVFYEHLKEAVSRGRTMRTAIDSSFTSAFSTIVKADVASLIGAGILYWLTVGPVRGFAFFLGLGTLIDLVASWFFMRPLSLMLVKSERFQNRPSLFGMPSPRGETLADDGEGVPA
ncbi:MAG: protein translocase subunit SecD [Acidimicrobiales bacterium]|nr:protein translocase subunit SecD [Acidimicrobiales bacterium]